MADLVVIVPSRGRPEAAAEVAEAFEVTCTADTKLVVALDDNDPKIDEYVDDRYAYRFVGPSRTMVAALNSAANMALAFERTAFAVGFMGDDHRPRTKGWDQAYLDALRELGTGIVYGDDLLQGERLPTQAAMTSDIIRALGYMAPPTLTHMYVDNFWLDLGRRAECIRYLPDAVVEHLHPVAGKADWDEGHKRVNAPQMYAADRTAYTRYIAEQLQADVAKVRTLRPSR
jgi:hypothetical protein